MAVFFSGPHQSEAVLLMRRLGYNVSVAFTNNCLKISLKPLTGIKDRFTHELYRSLHDNSSACVSPKEG